MDKAKRLLFIDLFKAFGVFIVILGHLKAETQTMGAFFLRWHAFFNMPMFFFISGYLYKHRNLKLQIKNKGKSLILPYLYFGIFFFFTEHLLTGLSFYDWFKYYAFINNNWVNLGSELWFLTALFFANIFFCFLKNITNDKMLIILICFTTILEFQTKIILPYSVDSAVFMLPIFYAGYIFKKMEKSLNIKTEVLISILFITISSILALFNTDISVRQNIYGNIFIFYLCSIMMSFGLFYACKLISSFNFVKLLKINYLGQNSLDYFCLNRFVIIIGKYFLNLTKPLPLLIYAMIILTGISFILNKIRMMFNKLKTNFII